MAASNGSGTLPSEIPSTSHASREISWTESSAFRCYVFRGQRLELLENEKLTTAQSQPKYTQASDSVSFQYFARNPAHCLSTSATNTTQTARAAQVYGRNAVSYLHYVERRIKLITSKLDSAHRELKRAVKLMCRQIRQYTEKIEATVERIGCTCTSGEPLRRELDVLNAKKSAYTEDLKRKLFLLKATNASHDRDIRRQIDLLNSKLAPFAQQLDQQLKLMNSKQTLYTRDLKEKMDKVTYRYDSYIENFDFVFKGVNI